MRQILLGALAVSAALLAPAAARADEAPELAGEWVNAEDLSLDRLRGKVVALYFFEEG